ncbi:LEM domain-containing protein 1 isoform X1 [Podarcis muralis]
MFRNTPFSLGRPFKTSGWGAPPRGLQCRTLPLGDMEKVTVDVHIENKGKDSAEQGSVEQDSKDEIDVTALSDTELWELLCAYGITPGPILPSTRTIYENKLLQLMKQCPGTAAELNSEVNSENDGEGKTTEVVIQTNGLKVTTEHTSGSENKSPADVVERQKKLLSSDVEHSLAKIVAELQEILPEGKVALHRSQGPRKKVGSPERNYRQKTSDLPHQDFGYPDVNVTVGESARRRRNAIKENPPSVKQDPGTKCHVVAGRSREGHIPMRVKIAAFAIFMFLLFVYVTMETNFHNPFTSFAKGK